MSEDLHVQPIGGHIQRQHQELQRLVCAIGHLFSHRPENTPLEKSLSEAHQAFADLRHHLVEHFAQEEDGGYLEEAVARVPRLGTCVTRLEKEHPKLLAEIDRIKSGAEEQPATPEQWQKLRADFARFARNLLRHEDIENRMLQEGFNDDLGMDCENSLTEDGT